MPFFKIVRSGNSGVVERFHKYTRTLQPGFNLKIPFIEKVYIIDNKVRQRSFHLQIKTSDDIFINVGVHVEYMVKQENSAKSLYSVSNPVDTINAYVDNVLRASIPSMDMNTLYKSQYDLCKKVNESISERMDSFGYTIVNTLIASVDPSEDVKKSMDSIKISKAKLEVASNEAEAERVKIIKIAQANAEESRLKGVGISSFKDEVMNGVKRNAEQMKEIGIDSRTVLQYTQKLDILKTYKSIGESNNCKVLFLDREDNISKPITIAKELFHKE